MSITREQVIEFLSKMTAEELAELIKELRETLGVRAATTILPEEFRRAAAYGAPMPPIERKSFDLFLTDLGDNPLPIYGKLREILPLSLAEVKAVKEKLPYLIKTYPHRALSESLERELISLGARVEVRTTKEE